MDLQDYKNNLLGKSKEELLEMLTEIRAHRRNSQTPKHVTAKKQAKTKMPKVHELSADDNAALLAMLMEDPDLEGLL